MLMLIKIDYETHYPHTHSNLFVSMMYFLPFISVVIIFNIISHNSGKFQNIEFLGIS